MPISCRHQHEHGRQACATDCPAADDRGLFRYARVELPDELPPADERTIDVAILDMNHGWPNLGHDSLVQSIREAACDLLEPARGLGLQVRAVSFDVRRRSGVPELPGGRFALYLGTGGPGHLDPHLNDGVAEESQGVREDAAWEQPLFALFDAILASREAALLAVCHTFGVLCRWSGIASPVLRGEEKGGKSSGVLENLLTAEAERHPWFGRFAAISPNGGGHGRRLRILDNRLFDLIPGGGRFPAGILPIGYEALGVGGPRGDALTMLEFARDPGEVMPRVFGVNHHPEILDRPTQMMILQQKLARGEVGETWVAERLEILTRAYPDEDSDLRLHLTSDCTLLGPLRFHLCRQLRQRAEALGLPVALHEDMIPEAMGAALCATGVAS